MKKKRDIFTELTEGFDALKSQRESVQRGRTQVEFIANGTASLENTRHNDEYVDADVLIGNLERKLGAVKASRTPGKPRLTPAQKLKAFNPAIHGVEVMTTGRIGAELF